MPVVNFYEGTLLKEEEASPVVKKSMKAFY